MCLGFVYTSYISVNKIADYIQNELPDLSYQDGILNVNSEEAIVIQPDTSSMINKIIIDTKVEDENVINEYVNSIEKNITGLIFLKDKVILKNTDITGNITYKYDEILMNNTSNFTKQDLINYITGKGMISLYLTLFIVMLIYTAIIYVIATLTDALIISIFGWLTTLFARIRLKYSEIISMSIYSLTLPIILNIIYIMVNMFTQFEITYFQIMYTAVAYIYLATAIFMIKADLSKRQMEVQKIIEVQDEKNRDEEKEREENKKDNNENNKNEKKDENKKEKDKDNNLGGNEPEGSNA